MSRIGKKVIAIPAKTKVEVKDNLITATGALGTLSYTIPAGITAELKDGNLTFSIPETGLKNSTPCTAPRALTFSISLKA